MAAAQHHHDRKIGCKQPFLFQIDHPHHCATDHDPSTRLIGFTGRRVGKHNHPARVDRSRSTRHKHLPRHSLPLGRRIVAPPAPRRPRRAYQCRQTITPSWRSTRQPHPLCHPHARPPNRTSFGRRRQPHPNHHRIAGCRRSNRSARRPFTLTFMGSRPRRPPSRCESAALRQCSDRRPRHRRPHTPACRTHASRKQHPAL